jgi:hypothetical protein
VYPVHLAQYGGWLKPPLGNYNRATCCHRGERLFDNHYDGIIDGVSGEDSWRELKRARIIVAVDGGVILIPNLRINLNQFAVAAVDVSAVSQMLARRDYERCLLEDSSYGSSHIIRKGPVRGLSEFQEDGRLSRIR